MTKHIVTRLDARARREVRGDGGDSGDDDDGGDCGDSGDGGDVVRARRFLIHRNDAVDNLKRRHACASARATRTQ